MQGGTAAVERVFREEYGRLIASLVRRFTASWSERSHHSGMMPTAPGVVGPATILALGSCAEPSPWGASAQPDFGPQVQVAHPHPAQLGEGTAGSQLALADIWRFGGHRPVLWAFTLADALGMTGPGQRHERAAEVS